ILIVGDVVNDSLRATVPTSYGRRPLNQVLCFPKRAMPRRNPSRCGAPSSAGRIVCYQCDDDLWLPGHLQDMETALEAADFAGSMHADVSPEGRVRGYVFDLERPEFREPWLTWTPNRL